jgi:hypothetical protein
LKESDNYETDEWLMALFDDWHDPCPFRTCDQAGWKNGLLEPWPGKSFVNPPYSNVMPWVEKAILESQRGFPVVMLLKFDSSTRWWFKLAESGAHFLPIFGRLKFRTGGAASFPSVLVVLS